MGKALAEMDSECMDIWKTAEKASGLSLREIYWDGEAADMAQTNALQPGLTVVNLSVWLHARKKITPVFAAGHSLGEFSALCAAGVLELDKTLELVSLRGKLMSEFQGGGAMAAIVKLPFEKVEEIVEKAKDETGEILLIANYNTPAQFVISGAQAPVDTACDLAKESKGRSIALPVSGAFHSPFMEEPARELTAFMKKIHFSNASIPVVMNVTGVPEQDADVIRANMEQQMTSGVQWIKTVQAMHSAGVRRFVELGPKGVLAKMLSANLKGAEKDWEGTCVSEPDAVNAL